MPRRKNQSPNAATSGRDPTENVAQNSDVQQKWRDTTLNELQTMFSGSIDPEVVQLVLSESNYNGRYLTMLLIFYYHLEFSTDSAFRRFSIILLNWSTFVQFDVFVSFLLTSPA